MDENSKKTALRETLQSLRTPGELYVIMSGATKLPFVVCNPETFDDEILLYHREEDAKNKAKELTEAHYLAGVAKLVDDQLLAFYTSLYLMGVNGLSVNVGTDQEKRVQLKDLVVRQNMKEAGEGKMIVENPEMHLTAIYLMQELRHQTGGEVTDQIKELQEELLAHYQKGTFLISVQEDGQIPVLKQKDGSMYQPIFTDILEFRRFAGDKKLKMLAIPSAKIPEALIPDARGVVINPLGVNVQLTVHRPKKKSRRHRKIRVSSGKLEGQEKIDGNCIIH